MKKVTIVKQYRNTETLRQMELAEVAQMIQNQAYREQCKALRDIYPLIEVRQKYDAMDGLLSLYTKNLPKVCFASQKENKNKQRVMRAYNGLVLLEVNNLAGFDEARLCERGLDRFHRRSWLSSVPADGA